MLFAYALSLFLPALISCANPPTSKCFADGDVALTFEGGPDAGRTPPILDALKKYNATATFFLRAVSLDGWGAIDVAKRILKEGHVIGLLVEPTLEQSKDLSLDTLSSSVNNHLDIIEKTIGKRPKYLRANFVNTTVKFGDFLNSNGFICTVPTIDTMDHVEGQSPFKNIINELPRFSGPIIKLHDTSAATSGMAKDIIDYIKVTAKKRLVDIVNCTGMAYAYSKEDEKKKGKEIGDRPLDTDGGLFGSQNPLDAASGSGTQCVNNL
jgi:peptidoglycan/xylan/chitin deacetylase (PgdA/CDA1 family)